MKLTKENVHFILLEMLDNMEYWSVKDEEAEKQLCYIAGMTDMAKEVIRAIEDLGTPGGK